MKKNYVNNSDLYVVMKKYHQDCRQATDNNLPRPRVPDYVGQCLILISTRLANKPNFCNYTYKDEMIADGIENCLLYIHNFNPERSNKPFAYFTQIIKFAFIRRIEREKKQQYIKIKNLEYYNLHDRIDGYEHGGAEINEITDAFVENFENKLTSKKKPAKLQPNTVNKFFV